MIHTGLPCSLTSNLRVTNVPPPKHSHGKSRYGFSTVCERNSSLVHRSLLSCNLGSLNVILRRDGDFGVGLAGSRVDAMACLVCAGDNAVDHVVENALV